MAPSGADGDEDKEAEEDEREAEASRGRAAVLQGTESKTAAEYALEYEREHGHSLVLLAQAGREAWVADQGLPGAYVCVCVEACTCAEPAASIRVQLRIEVPDGEAYSEEEGFYGTEEGSASPEMASTPSSPASRCSTEGAWVTP